MKRFIKRGTALVAAAMLFTGCGEKMAVLTESEEAIVVNYSAGTLAKHNSHQQEGMTSVYPKDREEEKEEDTTPESEEKKESEKQETEKEEKDKKDKTENTEKEKEPSKMVSLTEALAVSGIEFSYKDYFVSNNYKQGDYFSLDASLGKTFVILNINLSNTSKKAITCNLLASQPIFTLKINEAEGTKNEVTILENDLSTYTGTLDIGQTATAILLFEVPEKTAENISSLQLNLQLNGKTSQINMK